MPTLRIVSVNDVYSLENLPRLKSLVAHHTRPESGADAFVVVLAGDFVAPSLLSSLDAGRGMVDCMNDVGVTHLVLGNHEDDIPPIELRKRLRELHGICIGTNVRGDLGLPRHVIVRVTEGIDVGLVGGVMADLSIYRGKPFGVDLVDANDAILEETRLLHAQGVRTVIPITHQWMADDRALALAQAHQQPPFPAIIGGHEHVPMLVEESGTWIVKAGSQATHALITELAWSSPDALPTTTTRLEDVAAYPEDAELRAKVDQHMVAVRELTEATLLYVPPGTQLSSVGTRRQQTTVGSLVCSRIRDALGAEVCLFNGGGIRAGHDYVDRFTYGDIEAEVPFDNEVVVVGLPGQVIVDAIVSSRAKAPVESGAFLQVDDAIVVENGQVVAIAGAPVDLARIYEVATVRELLLGLDHVAPLVAWAKSHPLLVPPTGCGREPKMILVQAFALAIWEELGGFDAVDSDKDDVVTAAEIAQAVVRAHPSQAPSPVLADLVLRAVDHDADHVISRADAAKTGRR